MANVIKIKRSTSTNTPTSLAEGELAYSESSNTLFIGTSGDNIDNIAGIGNTALITGQTAETSIDGDNDYLLVYDGSATGFKKVLTKYVGSLSALGLTASASELNTLDGITASTAELNLLDGVTATTNELNILDGVTATASELNTLDGITASTTELNYLDLTAAIGTGTASEAVVLDANGDFDFGSGDISATDITATGDINGTLATAAQTNITSVGTLNGITIAGSQTIDMGSNRVTGVAEPTQSTDAATKNYVDAVKTGLDVKDSVRAATTGNITISTALNNGDTIDGVTLVDGDRVLVKDQSTGSENGIYVVGATPARAIDFDADSEVSGGAFTFVEEGTVNADSGFVVSTNGDITVGTTAIAFSQFSGAGQVTAGDALTKTGNTLDVAVDDSSIEVSGDALQVKALGITNAMLAGSIDLTTKVTGTLDEANGGTGQSSYTSGDILYASGSTTVSKLNIGTSGQFLSVDSGSPAWTDTIDGGTF